MVLNFNRVERTLKNIHSKSVFKLSRSNAIIPVYWAWLYSPCLSSVKILYNVPHWFQFHLQFITWSFLSFLNEYLQIDTHACRAHVCMHTHTHTYTRLFYLTLLCLECVCGHAIATVNLWRVGTIYWSYLFFPAQFL